MKAVKTALTSHKLNIQVNQVPGSINPSLIISSANQIDPALRTFLESQNIFVPTVPSGASGDVTINTSKLIVSNGAQATVRNDGTGNAGLLTANVDTLYLNHNAGMMTSTQQGSGGNIRLRMLPLSMTSPK